MREKNQLLNVIKIIEKYKNTFSTDEYFPLHQFLKNHFRENRQMGSTDRRVTSNLLYNYFRLGKILKNLSLEERIAIGSFICENENSTMMEFVLKNYSSLQNEDLLKSLNEKFEIVKEHYSEFDLNDLFPFKNYLSENIDGEKFYKSFFIQPRLWIRILNKVGTRHAVSLLEKENISFQTYNEYPNSISFPNKTSLDKWKDKGLFEIQDLSSQLVGKYFSPNDNEHWWDCCAGSGGKTLLLADQNPTVKILATDNRESILRNLKIRIQNLKSKNISTQLIDLTLNYKLQTINLFDGIIADVPCSGSGTWSRTPEMLSQFSIDEIEKYQSLQMNIVQNVIPHLRKDKPLIYITCSVFKKENEDVVKFLMNECGMKLEKMELLKGYDQFADTMFVARLIKN